MAIKCNRMVANAPQRVEEDIPLERRARAFEMNAGGWSAQLENIAGHVAT
jgi:hypothetical protein